MVLIILVLCHEADRIAVSLRRESLNTDLGLAARRSLCSGRFVSRCFRFVLVDPTQVALIYPLDYHGPFLVLLRAGEAERESVGPADPNTAKAATGLAPWVYKIDHETVALLNVSYAGSWRGQ